MDKIKIKNFLSSPLVIIFFTFICLLAIFSMRESSKKALVSKESLRQLEESVKIEEENLAKEAEKLKSTQDNITIEKIKRNELLKKKEGEIIIQIPEKEESVEDSLDLKNKRSGQWEEWKKLIFN